MHSIRRVEEANSLAMWSNCDLSELVMVSNNHSKTGNHKRLKSKTPRFIKMETLLYVLTRPS